MPLTATSEDIKAYQEKVEKDKIRVYQLWQDLHFLFGFCSSLKTLYPTNGFGVQQFLCRR